MVICVGAMSMWRRISGSTPWPMLPKPTMTMRPENVTCFWSRAMTGNSGEAAEERNA